MALQIQDLEDAIKAAFDHGGSEQFSDPAQERAYQAKAIANAISTFIKSGTVKVTSITALAGNVPVTGTGIGNIT